MPKTSESKHPWDGPERRELSPRIALAQVACKEGDKEANLETSRRAVAEAKGQGADLVILPEMMLTGFLPRLELEAVTESRDGPATSAFREMARENEIAVVAGLPEWVGEGSDLIRNAIVVFGRSGELLTRYHKTHLWDLERLAVSPGETLDSLFTFMGVRFGVLCCFDVEFPETARELALAGAECILVPTGNMLPWDHHHRAYITARALENHVFVAYANRCDTSPSYEFPGESALVDPFGRLVLDAGAGEKVVSASVDLSLIQESRLVFDYLRERRPQLYRGW